ncbi:TetR/AcrR family transcriptional regulator [Liquorilactobacillus satsumensis]|nr:TetR/AcrR family transcriptional regulator [Liquorilactobacillus satsumensis]MCP9313884.1 TetR/AcrR family transcriptional regulator [Liquorilactobacillus satsumensis]MCP9361025.1 TetR/AcrR family transcriptional regulator [Liquorilactobacillus satsumensis]
MNNHNLSNTRATKRLIILNSARLVFAQKGFLAVTMQDIIQASKISRGGLYLYFHSVDELFIATISERSNRQFDDIRAEIKQNPNFNVLLNSYLAEHKKRLLTNVKNGTSLLRAMYEYSFTHDSPKDRQLKKKQMNATKATVRSILELGVQQQAINMPNVKAIADNFMLIIEGMSVLALAAELKPEQIDDQFKLFKDQLAKN